MRVITRNPFSGILFGFRWHILAQRHILGTIHRTVLFRRSLIRRVRWTPRQREQKGILRVVIFNVFLHIARLCNRVVPLPCELLVGVIRIIKRIVVIVRTLQHLPIVKPLPIFGWNIIGPPICIHMPLAHISGIVSRILKSPCQTNSPIAQMDIIDKNAMRQRILPRQQRRTRRATNRTPRNRVCRIDTLRRETVDMRRLHT